MPRALGTFLKLRPNEKFNRYHYYLQLPDQLMDVVERDPNAPQAERIAELAHSFAHDMLTVAVLASRCLWYEALAPDSRSGDLPAVSTDLEAYFLFLKAACDVLAELTVELAFEPKMRGQAPSGSFHDLTRWIIRDNTKRIDSRFHFLAAELEWFNELHGIRTNLAHRGYDTLVYTNRVTLSFRVGPTSK